MDMSKITALRKKLHETPESALSEQATMDIIADFLSKETSLVITRMPQWFFAYYDAHADETVAFRADMDAVCVNGILRHCCGHDGHSSALCALACEIDELRPNKNVYFIFQPAEETGQGAKICREFLDGKGISRIYGFHNLPGFEEGVVYLSDGTFACASKGVTLKFFGKQSHAAYPEDGSNPAFAIAEVIRSVKDVIHDSRYNGLTLATIVSCNIGDATPRFGVNAGSGSLSLTLRAHNDSDLSLLTENVIAVAVDECNSQQISFSCEFFDVFPETKNTHSLVEAAKERLSLSNVPFQMLAEPFRWSEDFGEYSKLCPSMFFGIGAGNIAPLHTENYEYNDNVTAAFIVTALSLL